MIQSMKDQEDYNPATSLTIGTLLLKVDNMPRSGHSSIKQVLRGTFEEDYRQSCDDWLQTLRYQSVSR